MEAGESGPGGRAGSSADSLAEEEEEEEDEEGAGSGRSSRTSSLVSGLLTELYSAAEAAAPSSGSARSRVLQELQQRPSQVKYLRLKDVDELTTIKRELNYRISVQSSRLLCLLKQKDRLVHQVQKNCDIVTACLQAVSQKRQAMSTGRGRIHAGSRHVILGHCRNSPSLCYMSNESLAHPTMDDVLSITGNKY
ncbi:TBC1 domain family member 30-like [Melopsittacus undulatus]|uniref:TBC1 domain family member 30-like n=1 Tax=Melopsittacus undulatus TaxID=13146 RepID=UPI00146BF516|nr:TBC1 domain family member 30-like [Melopsittacus undulatus]